jgi:hypothetical protein
MIERGANGFYLSFRSRLGCYLNWNFRRFAEIEVLMSTWLFSGAGNWSHYDKEAKAFFDRIDPIHIHLLNCEPEYLLTHDVYVLRLLGKKYVELNQQKEKKGEG